MPARSRTRKWSFDRRAKQSPLMRMLISQFSRYRRTIFSVCILILLFLLNNYLKTSPKTSSPSLRYSVDGTVKAKNVKEKIVEINDRQPNYKLYVFDSYEFELGRLRAQAKLLDNLKLHDKCQQNAQTIIVDVGASFGQFGLYAAACGCQVYLFEVDPLKIRLLEKSIALNSFQSRVHLIRKAVSDLPGKSQISMSLNTSSQISSNRNQTDRSDIYSVETIRLSDMNFTSEIYLLRVDVEGYELHVFRSAEYLFQKKLIRHVLFQYTPSGTDRVSQNDLLGYIRDILGGKRFYALHPKEPILFGPLYNEDIDQFYTQHHSIELERDVYVLVRDEDVIIDSKPYDFTSSFD